MLFALDAENARLCYYDTVPTTAAASYFDGSRGGEGKWQTGLRAMSPAAQPPASVTISLRSYRNTGRSIS